MKRSPEHSPIPESKEVKRERPALTVFLVRHGESSKDKTNPKRGLTETGRQQVKQATENLVRQFITDEQPDFNQWDEPNAVQAALSQALEHIQIHLRDSGTDRTIDQVWVEHDKLITLGVPEESINMPRSAYAWKEQPHPEGSGPGIAKRLKGVQGMDQNPEFRLKIGDPAYQESVGADDDLIAWALTPDEDIPKRVENRHQMAQRLEQDLAKVDRVSKGLAKRDQVKRPVVIANSHASIITLAASEKLNMPMEQMGEVANAEGLRFDFYGGDKAHTAEPFGEKLRAKAAERQD